jgi:hypothetical protein
MRIRGRNPKDGAPIEIVTQDEIITEVSYAQHQDEAWVCSGFI